MARRLWLLVLLWASACSIEDSEWFGRVPTPDPTHFRWCGNGEPEYLDPAMTSSTTDLRIINELFDGLTTHDDQGLPMPSLARSWDVSPDQTRFTFHLRDDARWSNGRPLDAADLVYSAMRTLHPLTASPHAETLWKLRNGKEYTTGVARVLVHDVATLHAGDVVEVLPEGTGTNAIAPPDASARRVRAALPLRLVPDASAPAHATLPAGADVTVLDLGGPARDWAWIGWDVGEGKQGWVPLAELAAPNAERAYRVRRLRQPFADRAAAPPAPDEITVHGRDLLMLPEALGVRAVDAHTVEYDLIGPTPYFVDLTLQPALRPTPREAVARSVRRWTQPERIVTSGPFHLTYWHERDRFELVKSPTFWGRADIRLERVTIYSMAEQAANAAYYYQGGCDAVVANGIPGSWLPVLAGETGGKIRRKDYFRGAFLGTYFYVINEKKLNNVHLRRALSAALDRSVLPSILKGGQIASEQFTPGAPNATLSPAEQKLCGVSAATPGVSMIVVKDKACYVPPFGVHYDLELARRELALARTEMGKSFPAFITVKFNTGTEYHKHIAEWVQHEWQATLGIEVHLESQEWKTFLKDTRNKEYDVARMGWIGNFPDPEGEFLRPFLCASPDNRPGFCNQEFERLFAVAEQEPDRQKRLDLVRQAEQIMMDDQPIIPMYVYTQHSLQKPYVKGLSVNFVDQPSLRRVWIDPDWRQHPPSRPQGGP